MKNISIKIEDAEAAALDRYAQEHGMTKSAVVREAMAEYMAGQKKSRPKSAYDLLADYVGCMEGPGDLSYNPKYMEDFGK